MTVSPQGQLFLCKTPLENDYKNQLTFSSAANQLSYFNSTIQKTFSNYTYIKKDNSVKVGENIDALIDCNYLFYVNTGFTTKYYYCFITDMQYVNENCTLITFETDCFQTWMFQINYHPCFVEREHVNDDTIGLHTVPENLETGEYVTNAMDHYTGLDDLSYVILTTEYMPPHTPADDKPLATNFGGVFMAGGAYITTSISTFINILQAFATAGKSDAVYSAYMVPTSIIDNTSGAAQFSGQSLPVVSGTSVSKPSTINGYSPVNNKLFCFPYNYLILSNNNGSSNILHYERFSTSTCDFYIKGVPVIGGSIKITPASYDGVADNEEEGLMAGKFPTLNWSKDEFTNWLTQNSVNIGLGVASSALSMAGGLALSSTGAGALAGAGSVVSGALSIAEQLGSIYQHSLQPNSAKGSVNGGDINVCSGCNGFYFYKCSIKQEYARIIDNFFSMFGYKVNTVKTPNITGRANWNYVKTIDCNFDGNIPQPHMSTIKNMFNNGVTLWHNPSTIYNYSSSNSIVS